MEFKTCTVGTLLIIVLASFDGVLGADKKATCEVKSGSGNGDVSGTILLSQPESGGEVTLVITLKDLPAGKHGFHVHNTKSLENKCMGAGTHLNLENTTHGAKENTHDKRHTGDLGNIEVPQGATAVNVTLKDSIISLNGANNVIGYPIVIHADEDDLGLGNHTDSNTTGHAGARLGCCLITAGASSTIFTSISFTALLLAFFSYLLVGSDLMDE